MITINPINTNQLTTILPSLSELLLDAVDGGASIGFLLPMSADVAENYWREVQFVVAKETVILLVAYQNEQLVGTVQLALITKPNGSHRAEVQKLLVHRKARRQGVGRALMQAIEQVAQTHSRSLLVLDTRLGDPSEQLYRQIGYSRLGVIPDYARSTNGRLDDCVFFYKNLTF